MDDARQENNDLTRAIHLSHAPRLKRMRQLSQLLDGAIVIPGTKRRIGLDPILGLIPGGGDTVSAALSAYIIIEAAQMGLPRAALMRMVTNIAIDTVVGTVPVFGDIFDVFSKANLRNMQIVESHAQAPAPSVKTDRLFIGLLIVGLIILVLTVGFTTAWVWSFVANSFK